MSIVRHTLPGRVHAYQQQADHVVIYPMKYCHDGMKWHIPTIWALSWLLAASCQAEYLVEATGQPVFGSNLVSPTLPKSCILKIHLDQYNSDFQAQNALNVPFERSASVGFVFRVQFAAGSQWTFWKGTAMICVVVRTHCTDYVFAGCLRRFVWIAQRTVVPRWRSDRQQPNC